MTAMGISPEVLVGLIGSVTMAVAVSRLIWWATRRNACWAMAAGVAMTVGMLGLLVLLAWLVTYRTPA